MNLIICLEDKNGYSLFGRRQSKDKAVRDKILQLAEGSVLFMNAYSAKQFENRNGFLVAESITDVVCKEGWYFVENIKLDDAMKFDKIAVFKWNRRYPSDKFFEIENCYELESSVDFPGASHDNITLEIYTRK